MTEGGERGLSQLYRASAQEVPPQRVDAAILTIARAETRRRRSIVARWGFPLALAAVLVLSVSLVMVMRHEPGVIGEHARVDESVYQSSTPAESAHGEGRMAEATPKADAVTASQTPPKPAQRREAEAYKSPEADRPVKAELAKESVAPSAAVRGIQPVTPAAPPSPQSSMIEPRTHTEASQAAAERALEASAAKTRSEARENATTARQQAEVSATGQSPAPAAGALAKRARADAQSNEALTPEQWIQRIEGLRKDGKHAEAEASLAEFRKRYPAYKLPDTLK